MTVKEAVSVLKSAKEIKLSWNGGTIPFWKDDRLQMDAFGNYVVDEIVALNDPEDFYEIIIAMMPVKEG